MRLKFHESCCITQLSLVLPYLWKYISRSSSFESYLFHGCLIRYATASARSDGLLLLCGGRDANSVVSLQKLQTIVTVQYMISVQVQLCPLTVLVMQTQVSYIIEILACHLIIKISSISRFPAIFCYCCTYNLCCSVASYLYFHSEGSFCY